ERLEIARDDRMALRVELCRSERRGEAAQQLVRQLESRCGHASSRLGADRRARALPRCWRAALRTPRWRAVAAASSRAVTAPGVPMRARAAAAAPRRLAVRNGAHHSPL